MPIITLGIWVLRTICITISITHMDYHSVNEIGDTDIIIGRHWTTETISIRKGGFFVWWLQHHWLIPLVLLALTFDYHWNTIVESDVQIGGDFSNGMTENAIQRGIWNSRVTDPITLNSYIGSSHLS